MTVKVQNLDVWSLAPTIELMLVDSAFADRLKVECSTGDKEGDGCRADQIIRELLCKLGMTETAEAYDALDLYRA